MKKIFCDKCKDQISEVSKFKLYETHVDGLDEYNTSFKVEIKTKFDVCDECFDKILERAVTVRM